MSDLTDWIQEHEPVDDQRIKNKFGTEGLKELDTLLKGDTIFVDRDNKYWYAGHWDDE